MVRKRPLNKKELAKNEEDIITTESHSISLISLLRRLGRGSSYRENKVLPFAFQDLIAVIGNKYQHKINHPPDQVSYGIRGVNPEVVFSVLDAILKFTLERTKRMRSVVLYKVLACCIYVFVLVMCVCIKDSIKLTLNCRIRTSITLAL